MATFVSNGLKRNIRIPKKITVNNIIEETTMFRKVSKYYAMEYVTTGNRK